MIVSRRRLFGLFASTALTPLVAKLPVPALVPVVPTGWTYAKHMEQTYPFFGDFEAGDLIFKTIERFAVNYDEWRSVYGTESA